MQRTVSDDPNVPEAPMRGQAHTTNGAALWDRVDQPAGPTLAVLDSIHTARQRLAADVERCRYVILPGHQCRNRDGAPLNEGQVCHYEATAQLREADRQPREQAVPCRGCCSATWNRDAVCDECHHRAEVAS